MLAPGDNCQHCFFHSSRAGRRFEVALNQNWILYGQGSVGGFGVDHVLQNSIDLIGAVRYQMTDRWAANLAYRHLQLSYKKGQVRNLAGEMANAFAHDSTLEGPILGLTYNF